MWYEVYCQFEGASSEAGDNLTVLVQAETFEEAAQQVRDNEDHIREFTQHSIQQDLTRERNGYTEETVVNTIEDFFGPQYALFEDGRIYHQKYYDVFEWIGES